MSVLAFLGAAFSSILVALFVGGVAGAAVWFLTRHRADSKLSPFVVGVVMALLAFGGLAMQQAYTTVQFGTVGLVVRFGGLTGQVFEPGLHWKTPFIDKIIPVSTVVQSYETSDDPSLSNADYRDYPVTAQTVDGQQIQVKYTVLFRIPASDAVPIVQNVGFPQEVVENVVKAHSRNLARLWAQGYTAEELFSGEGIFKYEDQVSEALISKFTPYGVILDDFLVRKVDFGDDYVNAIEEQQIAQEAIETAKYQSEAAEYEKERQIRLAEAEAERTKLLAEADAERQRLLSDSEAYGIESRGVTLREYPEVVQWEFVRNLQDVQWGFLPSEGVSPFLPVPSLDGVVPAVTPSPEAAP